MRYIKFKYKDEYSNGRWEEQSCKMESLSECIKMYGLDQGDVEYRIVENLSEEEYFLKLEEETKKQSQDLEME